MHANPSGFPKDHKVIGKHKHSDGQHFHFIWDPKGWQRQPRMNRFRWITKLERNRSSHSASTARRLPSTGNHILQMGHVWRPVQFKCMSGTGVSKPPPAIEIQNATSAGVGDDDRSRDGRKDYSDKSDPIREHDCIWCMACVSVCPPQAVKVDQSNLEFHEKSAGTFNESLSKGSAPPPHAH